MPGKHLILILFTVVLSALAQVLLKMGSGVLATKTFSGANWETFSSLMTIFLNKHIFFGMLIYVCSATLWIWVLSKVDISLAYPFVSLSFLITLGFGVVLFDEPLSAMKIAGTTLIMTGCVLIAKS